MDQVVKLQPSIKSALWGGSYFQRDKNLSQEVISELWELSVRGFDSSVIASGKDKGKRLDEVLTKDDVGPVQERMPFFPLLIKLIDAKENLSVQVHPSDEYALKKLSSYGKTEMWHIIDADEGCGLYVGFNKDYSRKEVEDSLNNGTILNLLNFFRVHKGDTFFIEAGTIHAIGKGVRLIEIQQNSDITYRLYDYLRKDKNGKYRELHIKEALDVINYHKYTKPASNQELLAKSPYFTVVRKTLNNNESLTLNANKSSFISFTFLDGNGNVNDIPYKRFDTFYLPYGKTCEIKGEGTLIISEVE